MQADKKFDIIVFGATGFTGVRVCGYLAGRNKKPKMKIAIAGRKKEQLEKILLDLKMDWEIVIASYDVPSTISEMASKGRVIINCVGPYRHFGLTLPEACIHSHSDYIDVCGEPEFLERTQLQCHDAAVEAGSLIVGACGFDSVPSDLGALCAYEQLQKKGAKIVDSIECFLSLKYGKAGIAAHYATYESGIYGMANISSLRQIRRKLNELHPSGRTTSKPKGAEKPSRFFYESRMQKWVLPFPGADNSVLRRTFQGLTDKSSYRPNISVFMTVSSFIWALILTFWGSLIFLLSGFSVTRKLLLEFPYLFSLGTVSKSGPSEEQMKATSFEVNIFGKGYLGDSTSDSAVQSVVRVSGPEPGYIATPIIVSEIAFILLLERRKLRSQGGVFTPALAFQGSSLVEKLHQNGVKFDILE